MTTKLAMMTVALGLAVAGRAEAKGTATVQVGTCIEGELRAHGPNGDWGSIPAPAAATQDDGEPGGGGTIGTGGYGTIGHGAGTGSGYGVGRGGLGARRPNVPQVRIGNATVDGELDKNIIRRYIRQKMAQFEYCYQKQLTIDPNLSGTVVTHFVIDANGRVTGAKVTGFDPTVDKCIEGVLNSIQFPKPVSGGVVQVSYPFSFRTDAETAEPTKDDLAWIAAAPTRLAKHATALAACARKGTRADDVGWVTALYLELDVDAAGKVTWVTVDGADDADVRQCISDALTGIVLAKRKGIDLSMSCTAVLIPPTDERSVAGLTADKAHVVEVSKDAVTVDGKAVDAGTAIAFLDEDERNPERGLLEIDDAVTMDRVDLVVWRLRDAGVVDLRFATKTGKTWTTLPVLQAFPALSGDPNAAAILLAKDAIHVGTQANPVTIARGKRGYDFAALQKTLGALARGTTLGIALATDPAATWGETAQAMRAAAKVGFVLVPLVTPDALTISFEP